MTFLKSSKGKITIAVIILLLILGGVYGGFAYYFNTHFFLNTTINGIECEKLTVQEVKARLQESVLEYSLTVKERDDKTETIPALDFGLTYVDDGGVEKQKELQHPMAWITALFENNTYQVSANITYDKNVVDGIMDKMECFQEGNVTAPANAYLNETETGYEIVPEVQGNTLNRETVKQLIIDAVDSGSTEIDLEAADAYEKPTVLSADEALNNQLNQLNTITAANITYDFGDNRVFTVDRAQIKEWIVQGEDGTYNLDESKVSDWVKHMAFETDTFGLEHQFKTSLGPTITLAAGGDYGWVINKEKTTADLVETIKAGTNDKKEPIYLYKALDRSLNDIGGTYVEVCITQQKMWCYKDGQLVVETNVVTGNHAGGYDTPSGSVWAIDAKKKDADFEQYNASVTFWLPFNGGVGIHDASWRSDGEYVPTTYLSDGSHGCVNTPYGAAEQIFNTVDIGYPVIVYYSTDQPVGPQPTQAVSVR